MLMLSAIVMLDGYGYGWWLQTFRKDQFVQLSAQEDDKKKTDDEFDVFNDCLDDKKLNDYRGDRLRTISDVVKQELRAPISKEFENFEQYRQARKCHRFHRYCPVKKLSAYIHKHNCVINAIKQSLNVTDAECDPKQQRYLVYQCGICGGIGNVAHILTTWLLYALIHNYIFLFKNPNQRYPLQLYVTSYLDWRYTDEDYLTFFESTFPKEAIETARLDRNIFLTPKHTQAKVLILGTNASLFFLQHQLRVFERQIREYGLSLDAGITHGCLSMLIFRSLQKSLFTQYYPTFLELSRSHIIIGVHMRFGDASFVRKQLPLTHKYIKPMLGDKRIKSDKQLLQTRRLINEISRHTTQILKMENEDNIFIFLATDHTEHVPIEKAIYGKRLLTTPGFAYTTDRDLPNPDDVHRNLRKALFDYFFLADQTDFFIQTSFGSFSDGVASRTFLLPFK